MYYRVSVQKLSILPVECTYIFVLLMIPRNSRICDSNELEPICVLYAVCVHSELEIMVKQSLCRPGYARSVPGDGNCQIL
jgi:hypothetical protein